MSTEEAERLGLRDTFMLVILPHVIEVAKHRDWNPRAIAVEAYRLADALLAERDA